MKIDNTAMADAIPNKVSMSATSLGAEASNLQQTIVLHDGGDAILIIGSDTASQQPVLVSKTAMIMASPVWKAMFERHWKENESTEIPLPDDDIEAMLLVLRIAHLRFHELPRTFGLSMDALLKLAVVCDKYDLVKLVRPFLNLHKWASCYLPDVTSGRNCSPSWFFIAWTFGYKDSFEKLATYTVRRLRLDMHGKASMGFGQNFPDDTPPGLLEGMMVVRKETLSCMLNALYQTLDKILTGPVCKVDASWEQQCRAMVLGSYVPFLINNYLYPSRRTAVDVTTSIEELNAMVQLAGLVTLESHDYMKIKAAGNKSQFGYPPPNEAQLKEFYMKELGIIPHKCCIDALEFRSQVRRFLDVTPSPVLESHLRHMDTQALK